VLVTGDVADHGLPGECEQARSLLTGPWPVLICPGNHDERAAFRRVLLGGDHVRGPAAAGGTRRGVHQRTALGEARPCRPDGPPAVAYHVLGDDGRLITHYRPVVLR